MGKEIKIVDWEEFFEETNIEQKSFEKEINLV